MQRSCAVRLDRHDDYLKPRFKNQGSNHVKPVSRAGFDGLTNVPCVPSRTKHLVRPTSRRTESRPEAVSCAYQNLLLRGWYVVRAGRGMVVIQLTKRLILSSLGQNHASWRFAYHALGTCPPYQDICDGPCDAPATCVIAPQKSPERIVKPSLFDRQDALAGSWMAPRLRASARAGNRARRAKGNHHFHE